MSSKSTAEDGRWPELSALVDVIEAYAVEHPTHGERTIHSRAASPTEQRVPMKTIR